MKLIINKFEIRSEKQRGREIKMKNPSFLSKHTKKRENGTMMSFTSSQFVGIIAIYGNWFCAKNSLSTDFLKNVYC